MNIIRKIAQPCGIAGGIWVLLAPLLIFAPTGSRATTPPITGGQAVREIEKEMVSYYEMGMAGEVLPYFSKK